MAMKTDSTSFLGKVVEVIVDRPLGTVHPRHGFTYPVNYGYVPGTQSPDGEALDVYVLGTNEPLETFQGRCIAVLRRTDDDDDKLIVVPDGMYLEDNQIRSLTDFQEQYFHSLILR